MILLDPANYILRDLLRQRLVGDKRDFLDMSIVDFDNVSYHVKTSEDKSSLSISILVNCMDKLRELGVEGMLNAIYGDFLEEEAEDGYDLTFTLVLDEVEAKEKTVQRFALLKRNLLAAPFRMAFDGKQQDEIAVVPYRRDECMYIKPSSTQCEVLFSIRFKDPDDMVLSKVFLQELQEGRRRVQNAPAVSFSQKEAPLELKGMDGVQEGEDYGFVTFVLFERSISGSQKEKTISAIQLFRNYLHYHIKCAKAYMHQRMRKKVAELLKVLNRAKPEPEKKEKKLMSGKTFKRK